MSTHMQNQTFNLISCMQFADKYHPRSKVITQLVEDNSIHEITYGEMYVRIKKLANALQGMGIKLGDRIGTVGLNTYRHLESWYAIQGQGAISHTINPRLSMQQFEYIINHAEDRIIFIDPIFWPIIEGIHSKLPKVEAYVVYTDDAHMPKTEIPNVHSYESLLEGQSDEFEWPDFDENLGSSLCYTSGTTGNPKGVMYTHKSNRLHAYAATSPEGIGMTSRDTLLVVVPLFHANSWSTAYSGPMTGANLIFPGKAMDGESIYNIMDKYNANLAAGVPTVWTALLDYCDRNNKILDSLKEVLVGGSAAPPAMFRAFRDIHNADLLHGWGMTEMSPIGTLNRATAEIEAMPPEEAEKYRLKQGRPLFGVDLKIVDEEGNELPRDGESAGKLLVKGNWVVHTYFGAEAPAVDDDNWFDTGDVANIDRYGYMEIVDRSKDLIKSGGEWISSVDMENLAMGHPDVLMAAAIAIPDEKWAERPLLIVVPKEGKEPTKEGIKEELAKGFAKWQLPDDIIFVPEVPIGPTGKISKLTLRKQYADYKAENA